MLRRLSVLILVGAAPLSGAAAVDRSMQELQRDVAQLQDLVKTLQTVVTEKLSALQVQVQSSSEAASQANAGVAAVQRSLEQMLRDQQNKLVPPMVAMGARMDQVTNGLGTMQQAVSDLASLMAKLQTQIGDLNNAVKVITTPPAPPPVTAEQPPMPAAALFENANGDFRTGKLNLALEEFTSYLKFYADTPLAPDAQYYVGSIHQSQNDLESAVKDFDALVNNYPDAKKVPDALFYKGKALMLLGRTGEATDTFKDLRKRFPTNDLAKQSLTIRPAGRE
jgi:tol-pal system protein YbgF